MDIDSLSRNKLSFWSGYPTIEKVNLQKLKNKIADLKKIDYTFFNKLKTYLRGILMSIKNMNGILMFCARNKKHQL